MTVKRGRADMVPNIVQYLSGARGNADHDFDFTDSANWSFNDQEMDTLSQRIRPVYDGGYAASSTGLVGPISLANPPRSGMDRWISLSFQVMVPSGTSITADFYGGNEAEGIDSGEATPFYTYSSTVNSVVQTVEIDLDTTAFRNHPSFYILFTMATSGALVFIYYGTFELKIKESDWYVCPTYTDANFKSKTIFVRIRQGREIPLSVGRKSRYGKAQVTHGALYNVQIELYFYYPMSLAHSSDKTPDSNADEVAIDTEIDTVLDHILSSDPTEYGFTELVGKDALPIEYFRSMNCFRKVMSFSSTYEVAYVGHSPTWTRCNNPDQEVPGAPDLTVSDTGAGIILTWTIPPDGGSAILGYNIHRSSDNVRFWPFATSSTPTYTDTSPGDGEYYKVSAFNSIGEGSLSSSKTITEPDPVTDLVAVASAGKITLTWTGPAFYGVYYRVYRSFDDVTYSLLDSPTEETYEDSSFPSEQNYFDLVYYKVYAVNVVGPSSATATSLYRHGIMATSFNMGSPPSPLTYDKLTSFNF